jgi:CubicO group peptidase (beta-lactamase class C family)
MSASPFATGVAQVTARIDDPAFSGVLSASVGETPLALQAWGMADRANHLPNMPETRFAIASGTKLFTALGIARLVESRRLAFDTPVADVLPYELPNLDRGVTVHHLLCHTSGIYDYYDEEANPDSDEFFVDIPWSQLATPTDYLPLFRDKPMAGPVGEPFRYNNGGFVLLGMVIEAVTGELYRDFLAKEVLGPAGMDHSGFFAFNQLPERTAHGYIDLPDGSWKTNIYNVPIRGGGDGGMYTTAADLDSFWRAFNGFRIVSEQITRAMLSPKARVNESTEYGYGIYLGGRLSESAQFIVGGDAGVGFDSRYFPDQDLVISILSNATDGESTMRTMVYDALAAIGSDQDQPEERA